MQGRRAGYGGYKDDLKCDLSLHKVHGAAGRKTSQSVLTEEASELEEGRSEAWTRARRSRAACCRGAMLKGPVGGSVMNPTSGKQSQVRGTLPSVHPTSSP